MFSVTFRPRPPLTSRKNEWRVQMRASGFVEGRLKTDKRSGRFSLRMKPGADLWNFQEEPDRPPPPPTSQKWRIYLTGTGRRRWRPRTAWSVSGAGSGPSLYRCCGPRRPRRPCGERHVGMSHEGDSHPGEELRHHGSLCFV